MDGIDQQPDPIPMRWLNAMLGRVFLSTYRTASLESWIIDRIMKKLERVKTPGFLSAIKVREVDVGSSTPFFSKPMLKELTGDGDASMEVHVNYAGRFRITIETIATINLSSRFKPYVVNLVLAVNLKELEGTLLFKVKKPPTNRLWFGFTTMPRLVLQLDPVVSTRQIKWALVLKPIESRIREVVSLLCPLSTPGVRTLLLDANQWLVANIETPYLDSGIHSCTTPRRFGFLRYPNVQPSWGHLG